jgi:hypothetical protein
MRWDDVRAAYPDKWLVIEALEARSEGQKRLLDRLAVVEVCGDGAAAHRRYRELHASHPERELYFVHTGNAELDIDERPWVGVRWSDAARPPQ